MVNTESVSKMCAKIFGRENRDLQAKVLNLVSTKI